MILEVDAGNTRLKWRLRSGAGILSRGAERLDSGLAVLSEALCRQDEAVQSVRVASVGTESHRRELAERLREVTSVSPLFAMSDRAFEGLYSAYKDPSQMGVDRWLAMVAAWCRYRRGVAVVDAGSALTIDFVSDAGHHIGGYILPGWQMYFRSLLSGTARVSAEPATHAEQVAPGRDTSSCVNQGAAWLWAAWAARLANDCRELGIERVVLTGGDGDRALAAGLKGELWPDLVLDGLARIPEALLASLQS